ncbi:ABC transporter ATP-binding protein [Leucobacter aridicollis]|uniref:ABC transporter ATP-binding protein n=1 Tax=Leucobacter aridicollis TaxID=283878 RepID=UPI000E64ACD6|nr:ABC transporter ATP-binding protein [Leucobacter aridicollis]UTX52780.1 ABC transporter ATP-binding protein [Leucobacter aridicollis]
MKNLVGTLVQLFRFLPKGAGRYYVWYSIATGLLAVLDTAALGLIVLIITPLASAQPIKLPFYGEVPESATVWIVALVCVLFILKGVFAVTLHWFATRRFARYELEVGDALFRGYTRSSWEKRSELSTAEVTRIVDSSMANTTMGFILPLSLVPGNALTFISVLVVLVLAQPVTALVAFVYLGTISFLMLVVVTRKSQQAGRVNRDSAYRVATIMTEMVDALKEVVLRDKLDEVGRVISKNRRIATRARANVSFLSVVPKYGFEAALIGGFVVVGVSAYLTGGVSGAVVAISLFAATGFRMIPAMNAVQSSFTTASANLPYARDVIRELTAIEDPRIRTEEREDRELLPAAPGELCFSNVSFRYPGGEQDALRGISLRIPFGSSLAIVGPSGSGKSTLIDLMLGLSSPTSGEIAIDTVDLDTVMLQWRRRVGYVPQRVALFDASIAQNVALTWEMDYDEDRVVAALHRANLEGLVTRGDGIRERIGERGAAISGGQQQRLGIARALYADPFVMVMDEATSSLDTATENRITESMRELHGAVTFITVAHRLATIRDYDQVCYIHDGEMLAVGTFDEVVARVPEFKVQAQLAGLIAE